MLQMPVFLHYCCHYPVITTFIKLCLFLHIMKEYILEAGIQFDINDLSAERMPLEGYIEAHKHLVIPCHDAYVEYGTGKDKGLILVKRLVEPASGYMWPLGGRLQRGVSMEDSIRDIVAKESGLELSDISELGYARTLFKTDPFGHGCGTDTTAHVFYGKGNGELNLDFRHSNPDIITPKKYEKIRDSLHPYVQDFMDKAIDLVK